MITKVESCTYPCARFDKAAADRINSFFSRFLVLPDRGVPMVPLGWQQEINAALMGWKRPDGTRVYRRGSIWLPKKQGKSPWAAGLMLYLTLYDLEKMARCYSAACDREQAGVIYDYIKGMVLASPHLERRLKLVPSIKAIRSKDQNAGHQIKALSADVKSKEGLNASAVIIDELHAHPTRDLYDTLYHSGRARRQALQISISTAGELNQESIGYKEYLYAKKVISGELNDPTYYAYIAEAGADEKWDDPQTAIDCSPSYGVTFGIDAILDELARAKEDPIAEMKYRRYILNQWTEALKVWISKEVWDRGAMPVDDAALEGRACWAGIDMSSTTDLTSYCFMFEPIGDETAWPVIWRFYLPELGLERKSRLDRAPYLAWVKQGLLRLTPGNAIDESVIEADFLKDAGRFRITEAAYDQKFCSKLAMRLQDAGVPMVNVPQTPTVLHEAMQDTYRKVLNGQIAHGGNPIMNWMISNCVLYTSPAGLTMPNKSRSTGRIDGVSALVTANCRAMMHELNGQTITYTGLFG